MMSLYKNHLIKSLVNHIPLLVLLMTAAYTSQANEIAGKVIMARGETIATHPQHGQRQLQRRSDVLQGDTLHTGADGRLQVRFNDNALLALTENSQMVIRSYQPQPANSPQPEVLMELIEGGFRTITGKLGKSTESAYRVETPLGSIGIRGTHYEARLVGRQLLVGAWNGTISLTTRLNSLLLGASGQYRFARIYMDGRIQPLSSAPAELETQTGSTQGSSDNDENSENSAEDNSSEETGSDTSDDIDAITDDSTNTELEDTDEIASPLDKTEDSSNEDSFELVTDDHTPDDNSDNELTSPDSRLSYAEYQAFLQSRRVGVINIAGETRIGTMILAEDGQPVFISLNDSGQLDVVRYQGDSSLIEQPDPTLDLFWGRWNADADDPILVFPDEDSDASTDTALAETRVWILSAPVNTTAASTTQTTTTQITTVTPIELTDTAIWVYGTPTSLSDIREQSGTVRFSGDQAIGLDSLGQSLSSASGQFDLDFNTGVITNGQLNASFGTTGTDQWQIQFDGDIQSSGVNTPYAEMNILQGNHGELGVDTNNSSFAGFLVGEDAAGFAGGFELLDSNANSATGAVLWQQQ
ncbi:FecR family protein [Oceanobacter mangrovi]|uniref:FecR family protein n=1 Tax=Oceanobacter mangrovi TaxID=2862510 RepID=UPI001C8D3CF4|nr:FecR family protein [Oceanobacter mangrovi]